jgi:hypothetical protein
MNPRINRKIAGLVIAGTLAVGALSGITACSGQDNSQVGEVEYGYYDAVHVYHYYPSPRVVYVTPGYYRTHSNLFANPQHHTYTVKTTSGKTTVTKTTKFTGGVSLTKTTKVTTPSSGRKR